MASNFISQRDPLRAACGGPDSERLAKSRPAAIHDLVCLSVEPWARRAAASLSIVWLCVVWSGNLCGQVPFRHRILDPAGSAPAKPYGKAVGDLSGDGQVDVLAVSADNGGIHWYEYPAWSKRTIYRSGSWSEDVQVADIDADGDLDVVAGNSEGVFYYRNPLPAADPRSSQWAAVKVGSDGTNVHDLEVADLNGDGRIDVVVRYEKENKRSVRAYLQQNDTDFTEIRTVNRTNLGGEGLGLGDLDGDGDCDIALGNVWCENEGAGTDWVEHRYAIGLPSQLMVRVSDLNADGRNEILVCPQSSAPGPLAWFSSAFPKGRWRQHTIVERVTRMHGLELADFDGDGTIDLHTSLRHDLAGANDKVSVWLNTGTDPPSFVEQVLATSGSHFSKVADVGGDGDFDIVGANWSSTAPNGAPIEFWENLRADR